MISVRRVWLTEDWMNSEYGFNYMELAIQSLDTLNDQIVQFIFSPKLSENDTSISHPPERDSLKSNLALMRRLLVDAQSKFRKVMDENKRLTARIDHSQQSANQEVNALKSELAERDRRLTEIGEHGNIQDNKEWQRQQEENEHQKELQKLRDRNSKLEAENKNLLRQLDDLRVINSYQTEIPQASELQIQLTRTEHDLARAKEALTAMKADRKRLKVEKVDLLKQMKQLYRTLEANEGSVRSYIHKFEEQIMEKDSELQRMQEEKEEMDKDKWELLQRAKEAAERAMGLRNSNEEKDRKIATLKHVLDQLRRELSEVTHRPVETTFPIHITTSTPYDTPCDTPLSTPSGKGSQDGDTDNDTTSLIPSENSSPPMSRSQRSQTQSMIADSQEDDESRILLISSDHISVSSEELSTNRTVFDNHKKKKKSGKFSSLSKVFGKKNKSTLEHLSFDDSVISINSLSVSSKHSSMVEIGLDEQEKLRLAELCKVQPMHQWRANTVLAWLELAMCLPQYTLKCAENVKSGKVLLGLSDAELEVGLGITNPLHKRKVRLAVEESRNPTQASYPKIGDLDHRWVCRTWLNDIGLPQYSATFEQEKIDGRVLNTLTKKDLEKHLNITVRFHQVSILYGIEVLRKVQFDKKILTKRRNSCEGLDADPLVWTNQRFIKWTKSIDLKEYANNLIETGVHGGVVVIDMSFTPEHLGTCLGISTTKNILRRHLTSEINSLIRPARSLLDSESGTMPNLNTKSSKHVQASLQRSHFVRSYMGNEDELRGSRRRPMFRGSIGRAFGRKFRQSAMECQNRGNFTDTRPKSRSHELLNHSAPS